jgi:hypothetical protein
MRPPSFPEVKSRVQGHTAGLDLSADENLNPLPLPQENSTFTFQAQEVQVSVG